MTFEYYDRTIQNAIDSATNIINESSLLSGSSKIDSLNKATSKIEDAKKNLADLQNNLIMFSTNERVLVQRKTQLFITRIKELEDRVNNNLERAKLFANASVDQFNQVDESEGLRRTQETIGSAVEIGTGILSTLHDHHSKLKNAMNNASMIRSSVSDTDKHVRIMERISKQNKLVVYVIIGLLVLGIIILLYLKF